MDTHVWSGQQWHPVEERQLEELVERASFVSWYDTIDSDPDRFSVLDLAIPAFLDAVPNFRQLLSDSSGTELEAVLDRASACLRAIPVHTDLWDWDVDQAGLKALFQATTGGANESLPGFGPAKCTKLLHRKRPQAVPIIDSWIREQWSASPGSAWTSDDMVAITMEMRGRLGERTAELGLVRDAVISRWGVDVSLLRSYDILSYLWHSDSLRPPG